MNEYSESLYLVDLTTRPEGVRMSISSGSRTGKVPFVQSCSFSCGLALTFNARGLGQ